MVTDDVNIISHHSMKPKDALMLCITLLSLFQPAEPLSPSYPTTLATMTYSSPISCSAFCIYEVSTSRNLVAQCTQDYNFIIPEPFGNGYCLKCDPLYFRPVLNAATGNTYFCIPHEYDSESTTVDNKIRSLNLGYFNSLAPYSWFGISSIPFTGLRAHHSIRVRFGVSMYQFWRATNDYPLQYNMDGTSYTYHNTLTQYWSSEDIVTSRLQKHTGSQVTLTFELKDNSCGLNTDSSCTNFPGPTCQCNCRYTWTYSCLASTNNACGYISSDFCGDPQGPVRTCCNLKYITITDLILFTSNCPDNCVACSTSTSCSRCDTTDPLKIYYRCPLDDRCYLTCPQTTYKDNNTLFLNSTGYNQTEYLCSTCNNTCLECESPIYCTKCFYAGRNQSFLYNNTCVNPCYNGYRGNYTTHVCECPVDGFYEINATLMCNPCAKECVRCYGPSNLECTYCQQGFYLANMTTYCLVECPDGQYKDELTRKCYNCDPKCSSCENKATICTKCFGFNPVRYLLGSECLTWCPPGYSWNNMTYRCEQCTFYTYSLNGKCVRFCPSMYQANLLNKSCIHLSKTSFAFNLTLLSVSVLDHGKLLKLEILAQDGLNRSSYDVIMKRSYYNVQVVYKDSMLQPISGVRNLLNVNLPIRNVQYINNKIYYYVQLPDNLDFRKSFQVVFLQSIAGNQDIYYNNLTNVFPVNQHPELMKSYYLFTAKNNFNVVMIPLVVIVLFLFSLQLKGVYDMLMEFYRVVQFLGLLVYSAFPVGPYVFYFLIGCSYSNLDFLPNLYAMVAKPQAVKNFTSFSLTAEDMDFIRLNGSVLFFAVIWTIVVLIAKYLFKVKENRMKYMVQFGLDLMQMKILHSFWSSVIFIVINYSSTNFSVFITFAFAFLLFLAILARRYVIWKDQKDISPYFVWRLFGTLLVCFVALSNELLISMIFCLAVGMTVWQFYLLHSPKYLISIDKLNSTNYMNEKTYKVLNNYDEEVSFSWAISIRNTIITMLPIAASIFSAILILLKDSEQEVIIFTSAMLYFFMILVIVNAVLIFKFLEERRKYLVQNKLEFLQKKYAKLSSIETTIHQERRRPRVVNNSSAFDEEKYLEQNPARRMMKNIE